jgi:hypothetical protein
MTEKNKNSTKTLAQAEENARKLVGDWVKGAVLTGWIPGSALVLTGADFVMLEQVAREFEVESFDKENAMQSIGTIAASGMAGGVIGEAVGLVPVIGWAVKSGMMGAKAKLIGDATIDYFKKKSPLADTVATPAATSPKATSIPIETEDEDVAPQKPKVQPDDDTI